ncbi:transport system permease protein [Stackebrandtia nassauensis DSM 44728]|uniref:Transport system permease protein n=2 Tax=Stackebrandtia TaxID=283810 RepID=D3Q8B9_STANL|nr:transport system permease protein [Stackebrandtia nassauensis DSM 44728]
MWTLRLGRVSARVDARDAVWCGVFLVLLLAASLVTLTVGTIIVGFDEFTSLLSGTASRGTRIVVLEWRLPRLLFAIVAGAALGLAGMLMQSITRNPLGSPDIMGFDAGAYTGVLVMTLAVGVPTFLAKAIGASAGGLVAAAIVLFLALRGGVTGFRLIILGIGTAAMLTSVNSYLLLTASPEAAAGTAAWNAGSFANLAFEQLLPYLVLIVPLLALVVPVSRRLAQFTLGDDMAGTTGVSVNRTRIAATVLSVVIAAATTAVSGPLTFIALIAPQVAMRLARRDTASLPLIALNGALLLVAADYAAEWLTISTGLLTICVGGAYFVYVLMREGFSR